ncbi:hypothetical protein TIFTF001_041836 [Ficus carica]|uniref:Uncharacterized protein n=1 Tax=Ficus carica TaxID=3494 RepID=A0AA87ZBC1_FICCA|nr:hypothetical protein TIFTF001_041836 [Ficus carica]
MFRGGERNEHAVPAAVQLEITGAEAVDVDEAEQAAGAAVAKKVSEIEEVTAGTVADVANDAVVDAANEVEEVVAVAEVVANAHLEEEKIDLSHVPLHLEAEHPANFAFMADRYARPPVAANADPAAVVAGHEIANPVAVPTEVVIGGEEEEVVVVEAGAVPAEVDLVVEEKEIDLSHVPPHLEAEHLAKFAFMADRYFRSPVAIDADPAAVAAEHEIANVAVAVVLVEFAVLRHVSCWIVCENGHLCSRLDVRSSRGFVRLALLMNSSESSSNKSMDAGGRLQNHLKAAPFKLCAKSLHIISSSMSVGMFID